MNRSLDALMFAAAVAVLAFLAGYGVHRQRYFPTSVIESSVAQASLLWGRALRESGEYLRARQPAMHSVATDEVAVVYLHRLDGVIGTQPFLHPNGTRQHARGSGRTQRVVGGEQ